MSSVGFTPVGVDGGGDALWVCTTAAVGRNGSRGGMLMRRDGDVFWLAKGGARALSVRGVEVVVGGETLRVIIHIIYYIMLLLLYIIIVVRSVRYPTPTAVVVYILPRFGHGPLSSCVRAFVCVYVFFGVYECVRVFVSVRFVQGRSFGLQARREIKGARRRLVSGAHTHTHTHIT